MKKFKVVQKVLCEVFVKHTVEAHTHEQALRLVGGFDSPTSVFGADYEIISDNAILSTTVTEDDNEPV